MKNKLKNYLKLGILLCVVSFTSCQKDDTTINEQQSSKNEYKVVLLEDIPNLIPVVNNVKRVQPKPSAATNRDGIEFIGLENVNTKNIIKITNETQKSTYTFRIDDPNTVGVNFENLHLIQVDNGYLAYIMSYQPDENWYNSTYTPEGEWVFDMSTYQGDITKYNLQREIIWSTNTDNSSARSNTITCTYSIFAMCDISYDHIRGSGCTGNLFYKAFRNCVASGGGGGNDTDPNDPDGNNTGGGGGSSSTVIPPCIPGADGVNTQALSGNFVSDQGEVEQETTAQCVENNVTTVAIPAGIEKFVLDLSFEQKQWWNDLENNGDEVAAIMNYLILNNYNLTSKTFSKEAIDALMQNTNDNIVAEVDFVKEIIYDIENDCQRHIVKEAFNNTSALTQTVKNVFTGTNTNYSYKINNAVIPNNNQGGTRAAATDALPNCVAGNCTFTTTLNTWLLSGGDPTRPNWNGATDLSIAKTVIHESLHALLSYMFHSGALTTSIANPTYAQLAEAYALHQATNTIVTGQSLNVLQHEFMVSFVDEVASALQQVGQNLGYTNSFSYYQKLAWSGSLEEAQAFPTEFTALIEEEAKAIGLSELYNRTQPYLGVDTNGNGITIDATPKGSPANNDNSNCN